MAFNYRKHIALIAAVGILSGCVKKDRFEGPDFFEDGFESYNTFEDLLPEDDVLWSYAQQTLPGNNITIDTSVVRSGQKSLKFVDVGMTDGELSKCSIVKQKMAFWEGETVYYSVWYYLESGSQADWLFLCDLEEQVPIGAGPGMRLALVNDSAIVLEHKYPNPNVEQESSNVKPFPRDQWVHLEFETLLSKKDEGYVKVWQDGEIILEKDNWKTLPTDTGPFMQGTKGMYSSIEIGLTANSGSGGHTLYADDFKIERR